MRGAALEQRGERAAEAALVGDWPVGTVVERRLDELVVRPMPRAV